MSKCKKNYKKKFFNSIKLLLLLISTGMSSTEYQNIAYVQYWDVLIPGLAPATPGH